MEEVYKEEHSFQDYINCLLLLPQNETEEVSSSKKYPNPSLPQFRMCVKIRCTAFAESLSKAPLDLIKELVYLCDNEQYVKNTISILKHCIHAFFFRKKYILLEEINTVLIDQKNKVVNSTWITDLLGQIQTTIAEEEKFSSYLELFFDVLIISVTVFSGFNVFVKHFDFVKLRCLFPASLAAIAKTTYFNHQTLQVSK